MTTNSVDDARTQYLPYPITSFIGREREIAQVRGLLSENRLLTLAGVGGIGKTRLGLEVAGSLCDAFADGVWVVELAAIAEPTQVQKAVAAVLGIRDEPDRLTIATLATALSRRDLLLVLDNCEHVIDACSALADMLLRHCPGLRILATSRQPLEIPGETIFRVPSLGLSTCLPSTEAWTACDDRTRQCVVDPDRATVSSASAASDAVLLFVERARAAMPGFALTSANAAAVETICRRLDGIPLAIELAAVRVPVLSPEQIASRLDDRFRLLSGGGRSVLPRYRTLRALLDWSHDLLDEPERILLRRLAIFSDGWTLEAAEEIVSGDGLEQDEILDVLSSLVAKSLVMPGEQADGVRYRFLESLREYAIEKLRDAEEEGTLRQRHRAWFVALAEHAGPELVGPRQDVWLNRLDRERGNLRAVQRWAVEQGDGGTLAQMGAALWQFWWARGDAADARELIEAMLTLGQQCPPSPALARGLHGIGTLAGSVADYETCRLLFDRGLAVARQLDDPRVLASLLDSIGRQAFIEGRYADARPLLTEGVAIFRSIGDARGLARALSHLGFLDYLEGRQESARAVYHEGLALARQASDSGSIAEFFDNLGRTYHAEGDLDRAVHSYREAVAIWRETGQGPWLAMALNNLGSVLTLRGELCEVRALLAEALGLSRRMGNRRRLAFTLCAVATLAAVAGEPERAVRLEAAASRAVSVMGASLLQPMYAEDRRLLERSRLSLGQVAAAIASTGRAMTLEQAVDDALVWLARAEVASQIAATDVDRAEPLPAPSAPPVLAVVPRPTGGLGLSRRELEVVRLVARGMTNRQIARELVITEGTAANHVKHILGRLALDSRVQIAAWAVEQGLHRRTAS